MNGSNKMVTVRRIIKNGKTFTVAELNETTSNGKFVVYRGRTTNITKFKGIYKTVPDLMKAIEKESLKNKR